MIPIVSNPCGAPAGAADGSLHVLMAPQGVEIRMRWVAGDWVQLKSHAGYRMAWTPSYLSRAGWAYLRPADVPRR